MVGKISGMKCTRALARGIIILRLDRQGRLHGNTIYQSAGYPGPGNEDTKFKHIRTTVLLKIKMQPERCVEMLLKRDTKYEDQGCWTYGILHCK